MALNGIILYKGKYGATQQYANWLSDDLYLPAIKLGKWGDSELKDYDYIILGSSVYMGTLQARNWLIRHSSQLARKKIFLFVVCGTPPHEKEKLAGYIRKSVPAGIMKNCSIFYLPGKLVYRHLSILDKFMLRMGARLEKDTVTKKRMLTDYNDVKREHLASLVGQVQAFTGARLSSAKM